MVLDILMIIFGTNKVWYLYLVIPGFAIYKLSGFILPFIKRIRTLLLKKLNKIKEVLVATLLPVNVNKNYKLEEKKVQLLDIDKF